MKNRKKIIILIYTKEFDITGQEYILPPMSIYLYYQ